MNIKSIGPLHVSICLSLVSVESSTEIDKKNISFIDTTNDKTSVIEKSIIPLPNKKATGRKYSKRENNA